MTLTELERQHALLQLKGNPEPQARASAASALACCCADGRVTEALIDALSDTSLVAWAATDALVEAGPVTLPALLQRGVNIDHEQDKVAFIIGAFKDPRGLSHLIEQLNSGTPNVRLASALALMKLGPKATAAICSAIPSLTPAGTEAACKALGALGDPGAVDTLHDLLNAPHDITTRLASVNALGQIHALASVDALIYAGVTDSRLRSQAWEVLAQFIVLEPLIWKTVHDITANPGRRVWWYKLAQEQHTSWIVEAAREALRDKHYLSSLNTIERWRYRQQLKRISKLSFGIASTTTAWRSSSASPPTTVPFRQAVLVARYGQQPSGGIFSQNSRSSVPSDSDFDHNHLGDLTVHSDALTCTLRGRVAWSLDLSTPLQVDYFVDRSDVELNPDHPATVHLVMRQRSAAAQPGEVGVSVHILDSPALRSLPVLRRALPYVTPARGQQLLDWISGWNRRLSRR